MHQLSSMINICVNLSTFGVLGNCLVIIINVSYVISPDGKVKGKATMLCVKGCTHKGTHADTKERTHT